MKIWRKICLQTNCNLEALPFLSALFAYFQLCNCRLGWWGRN